ncbi:hypothetical protein [Henriciella pelagia]|nr:hypothetical protein [Henriciella pelagia]
MKFAQYHLTVSKTVEGEDLRLLHIEDYVSETKKTRTLFFAWQSDLPKSATLNPIRNGLRKAIKSIGDGLTYDHATREMSGSEDITASIREKIEKADIFVADISVIRGAYNGKRAALNPNVVFELGFAVAHLGWSRIILLFNERYGNLKRDTPFDFQSNRIAPYSMDDNPTSEQKDNLNKLLLSAIREIEASNPKRPAELKGKSTHEIQHERDSAKLRWLLEHLHLPTLDGFVHDAPARFHHRVFNFYYDFQSVFKNSLWHLYDSPMQELIKRFSDAWEDSLSHPARYNIDLSGTHYVFASDDRFEPQDEVSKSWDEITAACSEMSVTLAKILNRVRDAYPEIDLMETNRTAWERYLADSADPPQN